MSEGTPYSHPPVVEAIIELQFEPALSLKEIENLRSKLSKRYPTLIENRLVEVHIDEKGAATTRSVPQGFKGTSADNCGVILSSPNSFASVRLAPYVGWEEVVTVARENYQVFRDVVGHRTTTRIGVRYVNRIDIPDEAASKLQPKDVFNVYTNVPEDIPKIPRNFFSRYEYDVGQHEILVIIHTASADPVLLDSKAFTLDIDVVKNQKVPQKPDDIWSLIEEMRVIKNRAFESSVTTTTRATFIK